MIHPQSGLEAGCAPDALGVCIGSSFDGFIACEDAFPASAVVDTADAAVPEFDGLGMDSEPAPVWRTRDFDLVLAHQIGR